MTREDLVFEGIYALCRMNREDFYAIREEAELRLKDYFRSTKKTEIKLNRPVNCSFWNRGFGIQVDRIYFEDNNVRVGGKTLGDKDTTEFFSYIYSSVDLGELFKELSLF